MRNLVYAINLTIDGCCDHTKMTGEKETHEYFMRLLRGADLLVYGRITYQLMVPYWPAPHHEINISFQKNCH